MKYCEGNSEILRRLYQDLKDPSKRCIAFVGSGLSRDFPAEIPTWKETFHRLCEECKKLSLQDVAEKQREIAVVAEYDPEFLTQCFEKLRNALGQVAYECIMKRILTPRKSGTPEALKRLVMIPFDCVITTNLDELIENAAISASKRDLRPSPMKLYTSSDGSVQGILSRKHDWIWKIHGTIERPDTWIFTASEYSKSIYANPTYRKALETVVQGSRLVFLGFGGSDPDIEQILMLLSNYFGGREDPHILLTRNSEGLDVQHLANMDIYVIKYGGPEDHSALAGLLDEFPHFSSSKPRYIDFDDSAYREWLIGETDYIDIRGIGVTMVEGGGTGAKRFSILELYTKLYVRDKLTNVDLDSGRIRGGRRVELLDMANATRCLAIMGDPGSGKTTFLRYLTRKQLLDPSNPIPIYLRLGDVYEFLVSQELQFTPQIFLISLVDLSRRYNLNLTATGLENRAKNGQCWFLLDGLDELPTTDEREKMVRIIEQSSRLWKTCKFIITSRPLAMTGKSIPLNFELVGIDQLQDTEIHSFLETWTKLLFAGTSEDTRRQHCDSLLCIIKERSEIHQLARNPVMLTSMAVIHYNEKRLPEGRADLLEAVIQWLIHAKDRSSGSGRSPPQFTETMYRMIALAMFDVDGVRKNRVGRGRAAKKIAKYFDYDEEKALEFLRQEETETGILVRRGIGDLAFWHQSFQEYLAAKEIAGKTDNEETGWWSLLQKNLDKTEWREVICLVPACLNRLGSERVNLFLDRLSQQYSNADLSGKAKGVGLGGCILKDLQPYKYEPKGVSFWAKILKEIQPIFELTGQKISIEDRYNAAIAYGIGGDARLRDFEETWVSLPGGLFYMGTQSNDKCGMNYDPDSIEWESPVIKINLSPFEIRKYPITVEEFEQFISDGGYEESVSEFWTEEGWQWRSDNNIKTPLNWERQKGFPNCPISGVSWYEVVAYCNWLTAKELRSMVYRLPSEAEWEFTARHGLDPGQRFPWGYYLTKGESAEANWMGCDLRKKTPIGIFPKSNTLDGVVDMIGNIEEWCADSWSPDHNNYPKNGTARVISNERGRIVRGGSTIRVSCLCRPTHRSRCNKDGRYDTIGFRPVRSIGR